MSGSASSEVSERRNELSSKIKSFHGELRLQSRTSEGDNIWASHVESRKGSNDPYSKWMKELSSIHWDLEERSTWIREKLRLYFHDGGREKMLNRLRQLQPDYQVELDPLEEKTQVLDVGSCYNPFKDTDPNWNVLAIDLKSSESDKVYECDFISVSLSPFLGLNERVVEYLPESYFDILIFALFLEYLPLPSLRLRAIQKAYEVLKPLGLLFILTPDSSHVGKNVRQMKAWRACLGNQGFIRVYYEKKPHLHYIAYAKISKDNEALKTKSRALLKDIGCEQLSDEELLFISPDKSTTKEIKDAEDKSSHDDDTIYSFEDLAHLEL